MRPIPNHLAACGAAVLAAALAAACGDPFALPQANVPNRVDTVFVYALSGTPVATPSGLRLFRAAFPSIGNPAPVRTDQGADYDFAFEIDDADRAVILPTAALRLGQSSGGQISITPFDEIRIAPDRNFDRDSALALEEGGVAILMSRLTTCGFGLGAVYHYYAKIRVLEINLIDPNARRIKLEILVNNNCGYRGLEPGLPSR